MTKRFQLEVFGQDRVTVTGRQGATVTSPDAAQVAQQIEEARLNSFEQGYKAGWDDATASQGEEDRRIGAELARNLQDLNFTLHEARSHVLGSIEPLLRELVEKVLPRVMSESLAETVIETVMPLAEAASESEMEIVLAPANRKTVEALVQRRTTLQVRVIEDETLADGQVFLRLGTVEKEIDLSGVSAQILGALEDVYADEEAPIHA